MSPFPIPARRAARRALALPLAAALAAGLACGDDAAPTAAGARGGLTLLLTDAPGDFEKAVVTIAQIYLQAGEGDDAARVVLRDTPVTTDLLTLANATAELVEDAAVPAGTYAQLRFVITGGYVEVENADGSTSLYASSPTYAGLPANAVVAGALQMPSFAQSGLKVTLPGGGVRIDGEARVVLVDFDVARSFGRQAGASGRWVMQPVLTATELAATGGLRVSLARADTVALPAINDTTLTLGRFVAVLRTAAGTREELALADANGDGVFEGEFRYVLPGDYTLDFAPPSDSVRITTAPGRPLPVRVESGRQAAVHAVLTSAAK